MKYEDFSERQLAIRQRVWNTVLDRHCHADPYTGNRPCDNGILCDRCAYDADWKQEYYSELANRELESGCDYLLTDEERSEMVVTIPFMCRRCEELVLLSAPQEQWDEYFSGNPNRRLIQEIFPDMPAEKREVLVSGICSDCFNQIFEGED